MNNTKIISRIAATMLLIQFCSGKINEIQAQDTATNNVDSIPQDRGTYDIFKVSHECKVLFDLNFDKYPYSDTLYFEKNEHIQLCIYKDSIFFNDKLILCFQNVAAFEEMAYLISNKHRYLYFYPYFLRDSNGAEEEPGIPVIIKAWNGSGYLIDINKNNKYVVKNCIPYIDPTEFCSLPKFKKYAIETEVSILFDTNLEF